MLDADFALVMAGGTDFGPSDARKKTLIVLVFSRFLSDFQSFCTKIFGC